MKYHAPLLALFALATAAYASEDTINITHPSKVDLNAKSPADFTPFGRTTPSSLIKRQECATSDSYECPNDTMCCPNGYTCGGDGVNSWCCREGQICSGDGILYCDSGNTDCRFVNGGPGCCPTATSYCYQTIAGEYGCMKREGGSGSSGTGQPVCRQTNYFVCEDLSGCCLNGTTCVPGQNYCQLKCDTGYTECVGGCCPPGYQCDAARESCRKTIGSGGVLESSTTALTSSRTIKTSATNIDDVTPTADATFEMETPISTDESSSSSSSRNIITPTLRASTTPTQTQETATALGVNGAGRVKVPEVFGLVAGLLVAAL